MNHYHPWRISLIDKSKQNNCLVAVLFCSMEEIFPNRKYLLNHKYSFDYKFLIKMKNKIKREIELRQLKKTNGKVDWWLLVDDQDMYTIIIEFTNSRTIYSQVNSILSIFFNFNYHLLLLFRFVFFLTEKSKHFILLIFISKSTQITKGKKQPKFRLGKWPLTISSCEIFLYIWINTRCRQLFEHS